MNPSLNDLDLLEVQPCGADPLHPGNMVLFRVQDLAKPVVNQ
jgi:hypothetical protein